MGEIADILRESGKVIEEKDKRRKSRQIRRDGGEVGVENDTDDEELPHVYPARQDRRGSRA